MSIESFLRRFEFLANLGQLGLQFAAALFDRAGLLRCFFAALGLGCECLGQFVAFGLGAGLGRFEFFNLVLEFSLLGLRGLLPGLELILGLDQFLAQLVFGLFALGQLGLQFVLFLADLGRVLFRFLAAPGFLSEGVG